MKRTISILLAVLMLFCALSLQCFAAVEKLNIKVSASDNTYKVTWSYKTDVDKFYVFVDGKFDGYKMPNDKKSYSFTTDPYTRGVTHKILVKGVIDNKTYVNSQTETCVLTPDKAKVSVKSTINGYTISASVPSGKAQGYALYSYNTSTKKYSLNQLFTKSVSIISNTTDTYTVRAYTIYNKKYNLGACATRFSCKCFDPVKLTSAKSNSAGKITLTWEKPSYDITGYQMVYTSYDSFTYRHFKVAAKTKNSFTLNLVPGCCYKVAVRAYKTVSGKHNFGRWSAVKTLYTKANVAAKIDAKKLLNESVQLGDRGRTSCVRLNNALDRIINKTGAAKKTNNYEKIKCVYQYVGSEQFKKDGSLGAIGSTATDVYSERVVLQMLNNKGATGSCYEYNYLFHYLCLRLGLKNTYIANGTVSASGGGRTGHYWAMMKIGNNNYFFDPRMQRYVGGGKGLTFFCLPMNGSNSYSNYYRFCDAEEQLK